MPLDAKLKCYLTTAHYPKRTNTPPQDDVECPVWAGLLELAVVENGSYPAAVPFEGMQLAFGDRVATNILVYDGLGGYCADPGSTATLELRVTMSGFDSAQNPITGEGKAALQHPGPTPGAPSEKTYQVSVDVENVVKQKKAKLWLYFMVGSMC